MLFLKPDPKHKVNFQLCSISPFSKSSWIKTTVSGLSYDIGVNQGGRKLAEMYQKKARELDLKNIIWYSSYESSKTGKCNTFLVSFNIATSLIAIMIDAFLRYACKIFSEITHQTALKTGLTRHRFLQMQALQNLFLLVSCLCPGLILYVI